MVVTSSRRILTGAEPLLDVQGPLACIVESEVLKVLAQALSPRQQAVTEVACLVYGTALTALSPAGSTM